MAPEHLPKDFLTLATPQDLPTVPKLPIDPSLHSLFASLPKEELSKLLHANSLGGFVAPGAASSNGNSLLNRMISQGMKQPVWNKDITVSQVIALRNSQDQRFVERSAQNLPDWLGPDLLRISQMQNLVNTNEGNAFCMQTFKMDHGPMGTHGEKGNVWIRDFGMHGHHEVGSNFVAQNKQNVYPSTGFSAKALEEHSSSAHIASNFAGKASETMLSLSMSSLKEHVLSVPAVKCQPLTEANRTASLPWSVGQVVVPGPFSTVPVGGGVQAGIQQSMHASDDSIGKPSSAPLTIFYAGNVNVYDGVSLDKAQEIMHLAGNSTLCPTEALAGQYTPALLNAANSQSWLGSLQHGYNVSVNPQDKLRSNVPTGQMVVSTQSAAGQVSQSCPPANKQSECSKQSTPPSVSPSLPAGQPVVPKPLPLARKASLARFFEKRRERVQSKSPYLLKKTCPEQSLLPGERFSSSNYDSSYPTPHDECIDKWPVSGRCGMEGRFEYVSNCDFAAKDESTLSSAESRIVTECETSV